MRMLSMRSIRPLGGTHVQAHSCGSPWPGLGHPLRGGASRVGSTHGTQTEATEAARQQAIRERGEVVIHRPNGRIRDSNSYGSDPFPPKG